MGQLERRVSLVAARGGGHTMAASGGVGDGQLVPGVRLPPSRYSLAFSSSTGIAFFSQRVTGPFIIHPIGLLNWKSRPRTTLVPPAAGSQRKYPWNLTNKSVHAGSPVISILWRGMTTTRCVVLGPGRPMNFGRKWTNTPRPSGAGLIQWILPSLSSTFRYACKSTTKSMIPSGGQLMTSSASPDAMPIFLSILSQAATRRAHPADPGWAEAPAGGEPERQRVRQ